MNITTSTTKMTQLWRNKTTLLMCLLMTLVAVSLSSCDDDDDEAIDVKDYGAKTFSADLNYDSEAAHGDVAYKNQVYFSFSDTSEITTEVYNTDGWVNFNLIADSSDYNIASDVEGWEIVFSNYTANLGTASEPNAYKVTGVLINSAKDIEVAFMEYNDSENNDSISSAFSALSLNDVSAFDYSSKTDVIGYNWKAINMTTYLYTVSTNYFYIVKIDSEIYYKMRFVSFYGTTSAERIATIEYQLMQ